MGQTGHIDLKFKLGFPGYLCRTAFAILAMLFILFPFLSSCIVPILVEHLPEMVRPPPHACQVLLKSIFCIFFCLFFCPPDRPGRYILNNYFFIELRKQVIRFNIQFQTKQNNIQILKKNVLKLNPDNSFKKSFIQSS